MVPFDRQSRDGLRWLRALAGTGKIVSELTLVIIANIIALQMAEVQKTYPVLWQP